MRSIRSKIRSAIIGSILIVAVSMLAMLFINYLNASRNKSAIDTMIMEYSIIEKTDTLIQLFNDAAKNSSGTAFANGYEPKHQEVLNLLKNLKSRIVSPTSKVLLVGVENTILKVLDECDNGILEIHNNNFENISTHYSQAITNNDFVHENVSNLLQSEIEYLYQNQQTTNKIFTFTFFTSLVISLFICIVMIIFANRFSRQLISPLTNLSIVAKNIANGDAATFNSDDFKDTNTEVESLIKSISLMVKKLTGSLAEAKTANEEIQKTKDILEKKNIELKEMNSLMIGRELKMVELKHELELLRQNKTG